MLKVRYPDGRGILRELLAHATSSGFAVNDFSTVAIRREHRSAVSGDAESLVEVTMHVHGKGSVNDLAAELSEVHQVEAVLVSEDDAQDD